MRHEELKQLSELVAKKCFIIEANWRRIPAPEAEKAWDELFLTATRSELIRLAGNAIIVLEEMGRLKTGGEK